MLLHLLVAWQNGALRRQLPRLIFRNISGDLERRLLCDSSGSRIVSTWSPAPYTVLQSYSLTVGSLQSPRPPLQDLGADWKVSPFNRALEYVANCSSLSCWNLRALAWSGSRSCLSLLTFIVRPAREAGFRVLRGDAAPVSAERVLCECLCWPSAPSWPAEVRREVQHAGVARRSRAVLNKLDRDLFSVQTHGVPL